LAGLPKVECFSQSANAPLNKALIKRHTMIARAFSASAAIGKQCASRFPRFCQKIVPASRGIVAGDMPGVDIILDANIILADPGFRSPQSVEMLAYLRRTSSRLVIPTMVVEEVLERYRERLLGHLNAARSKWAELRKAAMLEMEDFPAVDLEKNVSLVRQKLEKPSAGVESLIYSDVSTIDVAEVARRGIKRKRPASAKGEELRDVILWLVTLQYARQTKRAVAFISDDSGFRVSKDVAELHADLKTEIDAARLPLRFYREIASFVRDNALRQQPISAEWVSAHVESERLLDEVKRRLSEIAVWGAAVEAKVHGLNFVSGVEYTISEGSTYVEAKYHGGAEITLQPIEVFSGGYRTEFDPDTLMFNNLPFSPGESIWISPTMTAEWAPPAASSARVVPRSETHQDERPRILSLRTRIPNKQVDYGFALPWGRYRCEFEVEVSARTAEGAFVGWQVDDLRMTIVETSF
jgi:hypothetical protein